MDELLAIIKQQTSTIEQLTNEITLLREFENRLTI